MFKSKLTILILVISIVLSTCDVLKQNEYYHLSSSDRSALKTGDTLIYRNNMNSTDTLFVFSRTDGTYISELSGSCKEPFKYDDLELVYFVKKTNRYDDLSIPECEYLKKGSVTEDCFGGSYTCNKTISFVTHGSDQNKMPYLYWFEKMFGRPDSLSKSLIIDNVTYENVYCYNFDNTADTLKRLLYSNKLGIIEMKFTSGQILKLKQHDTLITPSK